MVVLNGGSCLPGLRWEDAGVDQDGVVDLHGGEVAFFSLNMNKGYVMQD